MKAQTRTGESVCMRVRADWLLGWGLICFVVKEAGIVDLSCRTLFFSMTANTVYVGRVRGNISP